MPRLGFTYAAMDHVAHVAAHMRAEDVAELWALDRSTPHRALMAALSVPGVSFTALIDGVPAAMFGVADVNILTGTGCPWLLATDEAERHRRAFARVSLWWREKLFARYDVLKNFVHDDNHTSKRWLTWMGAVMSDPAPIGPEGEMFRLFEMRRPDV